MASNENGGSNGPPNAVYDISEKRFWNRDSLDSEMSRVFDICHQCRRCFDLCPSFDFMFKEIDRAGEDASVLGPADNQRILDLCYQCKLCYNHCPYTPPHQWVLDFPGLMFRARAVEVRERGRVTLQDKALGNPDLIGRAGSAFAPFSNIANRNALGRRVLEAVLGIHRDRNLPVFHRQTFSRWYKSRRRPASSAEGPGRKIALFSTCSVEYNAPRIGRASVEVLEHNGIEVSCPDQKCCGMPFLDGGDLDRALENARFNVASLHEQVADDRDIVVPSPTCSYLIKREYPRLLNTERARSVAARTFDICEYLVARARAGELKRDFKVSPGKIAYHVPCHLRAQNIGFKSRDLMKAAGAEVELIEKCSAIDGTWGFKKQFYQLSMAVAEPLFDKVKGSGAQTTVSDCPLAALQIEQGTGQAVRHPIEVIHQAYGLEALD